MFNTTFILSSHCQLFFSLLLIFASSIKAAPQIFPDLYNFCVISIDGKQITFPDKVWTIHTKYFEIHYSLCNSINNKCNNKTSSCLIDKTNNFINLGHTFLQADSDDSVLIFSQGDKCPTNPEKNYTLSVSLQCSDSIKAKPRWIPSDEEDECVFEATMMRPDCQPKCTEMIYNSYLLDIRNFPKNIEVKSDSKNFSLSLCGSNRQCGSGIGNCEILNENVIPLATVESQHLSYDIAKNELTARGRYKQERIVRDVQVLIKCNWATDLANVKYKKVAQQGRHYRFELESSYGCVKLPQNCVLRSLGNLHYNLEGLYKTEGWEVSGVPEGKIVLNICGHLNQFNNTCADQYSQVCHIEANKYTNRGSILSSLKAEKDMIIATFVSGSTCQENPQFLYSTHIEFKCSKTERGPIFHEHKNCVMFLIWETPHACPIDYYRSQNCYMNDRISNRNLQSLYSKTDKIYPLTKDEKNKLIFNLCGAIHESCNNLNNVSFCLKLDQNKEMVLGWENKDLISENGLLRMELEGPSCQNGHKAKVIVKFFCSYENPPPSPQITVIDDNCQFNVTVFTQQACASHATFQSCSLSTGNITYDLTPLSRKNKNYVISDEDMDYVFNLCGPIVTEPGALCRGDTMFCRHNKTEQNVEKKYTSLGGLGIPRLRNNQLVVEAKMGGFCEGLGYYKSVIFFECSTDKLLPVLVSKDKCVYNFQWKTPEACPRAKDCIVRSSTFTATLNLTGLQLKTVNINVDNKTNQYKFYLCSDTYTKCSNGLNETFTLKRDYLLKDNEPYIILDLQKKCTTSTISKVILKLKCSQETDYFEEISFEDCVINMVIHTHIACVPLQEKYVGYSIISPKNSTMKTIENNENYQQKENNCSIVNAYTGYELRLITIKSDEMKFNNNDLMVNFDGTESEKCGGLFCKNGDIILRDMCPRIVFNYTNQSVLLQYSTSYKCGTQGSYKLEVILKCNKSQTSPKILEDSECTSVILYNLPESCLLLKQDVVTAGYGHTGVIVGSVISLLLIAIISVVVIIYMNRRKCSYVRIIPFYRDKSSVPIYHRDCMT